MKQVKRIKASKFEIEIEDRQTEGYKLVSKTDNFAVLEKRNFGKAVWHVVLFFLTVWWTLGLGNLAYFLFSYFVRKDEIQLKVEGR